MDIAQLMCLKGRSAIVTGGGRGIGRFIAEGLAQAGANLVLTSRKSEVLETAARELRQTHGVEVLPVAADVGLEGDIEKISNAATRAFGKIDILVNNAGVTWGAPTLEYPPEKWDRVFDVNVRGLWLLTQRVARVMKGQGGGSILNISSILGMVGDTERGWPVVAYSASKAAVNHLTRDLAVKLAPDGIRVNAIAPGFFATDMTAFLDKPEHEASKRAVLDAIPMGRVGGADDIKGAAVFLVSDAAAFITGHVLVVDGGQIAG